MLVDSKVVRKNKFVKSNNKFHIISYGCQMNFADSEVVASILEDIGYNHTGNIENSNLILLNTCSIREKAEQTIRKKLSSINFLKKKNKSLKIGVLGCMAERLKEKFLHEEKIVDLVVGPDAYRDLPNLLKEVELGNDAVNVLLSKDETYADVNPQRFNSNGISAFVSITRGCDNMCTFCVVPFTRGRERSRDPKSIVDECKQLVVDGYKEVTLLGQNVDSYLWYGGGPKKDFDKLSQEEQDESTNFAELLAMVAEVSPSLRVHFSTSHPKDMQDDVLHTIAKYENICNYIHLPVQSGNSRILELMNRGYTREWYLNRIEAIRRIIPDCGISMDIISGFCTEAEEEHKDTLSLMEAVKYNFGYMFSYSERPNTHAQRKLNDDVPAETKKRRLQEIIDLQMKHAFIRNQEQVGKIHKVLVEGVSKKSKEELYGRNSQNTVIVFPREYYEAGDYVLVNVEDCTSATLKGKAIKLV